MYGSHWLVPSLVKNLTVVRPCASPGMPHMSSMGAPSRHQRLHEVAILLQGHVLCIDRRGETGIVARRVRRRRQSAHHSDQLPHDVLVPEAEAIERLVREIKMRILMIEWVADADHHT